MITMRYGPLQVAECFFVMPGTLPRCDLLLCRQLPGTEGMENVAAQSTLVIDLTLDDDTLFGRIDQDVRYEIRRAQKKDGVNCRLHDGLSLTDEYIDTLCTEYVKFARDKAIAPINRKRIAALRMKGELYISEAHHPEFGILAWHVYLLAHSRARLLYSLSLFRGAADKAQQALIGRANRLLHWEDMQGFRNRRARVYDFGGYYMGHEDKARLRINRFKSGFGGELRHDFNGMRWIGWKGQIARLLWNVRSNTSL